MKKMYYILFLVIITIILITILIITDNTKEKKEKVTSIDTSYGFYKKNYYERYIDYKEKFNFDDKKTILNVNIGLDKPFYTNPIKSTNLNSNTVLVNKYNYLPSDYVPKNLVIIDEYSKGGIKLAKEAYDNFVLMAQEAERNNLKIRIVSGYRSYDYQKGLYNNYLKYDTQEKVDTYSARPGFSEHQTGLAIDIDNGLFRYDEFHLTKEFTWVKNNAYKYGFILRYGLNQENITGYKYEPWHYRFVGREISEYIYKNDLTYEEYYYEFLDK